MCERVKSQGAERGTDGKSPILPRVYSATPRGGAPKIVGIAFMPALPAGRRKRPVCPRYLLVGTSFEPNARGREMNPKSLSPAQGWGALSSLRIQHLGYLVTF